MVSIHATRVGGDVSIFGVEDVTITVSIHATRVGGDCGLWVRCWRHTRFLSTPPVWVATRHFLYRPWIHSVSIHATRVGGDIVAMDELSVQMFLSTPPVWVATDHRGPGRKNHRVSIHATRVGGDGAAEHFAHYAAGFYPRHPCGWRPLR